jgi:hypothetical protein
MSNATADKDRLLAKIRAKRHDLAGYLDKTEPRHSAMLMASIVAAALSAALTAGPGVGGEAFIDSASGVVSLGFPVWQVLCAAASVLSVIAVVSNGLLKSYDLTTKIASARTCDAKLEGIETMLELEQTDLKQATRAYTQCLAEMPPV